MQPSLHLCLAVSNNIHMEIGSMARELGRRGGRARARALPAAERKRIAALGGLTRSLTRHAARRIEDNFKALAAADALRLAGSRLGR